MQVVCIAKDGSFNLDVLLIPVHERLVVDGPLNHWCLGIVNFKERQLM